MQATNKNVLPEILLYSVIKGDTCEKKIAQSYHKIYNMFYFKTGGNENTVCSRSLSYEYL